MSWPFHPRVDFIKVSEIPIERNFSYFSLILSSSPPVSYSTNSFISCDVNTLFWLIHLLLSYCPNPLDICMDTHIHALYFPVCLEFSSHVWLCSFTHCSGKNNLSFWKIDNRWNQSCATQTGAQCHQAWYLFSVVFPYHGWIKVKVEDELLQSLSFLFSFFLVSNSCDFIT